MKRLGSRAEVWHESARQTTGGLRKSDLMKNKRGRIVSKKRHANGMKRLKNIKAFQKTKEELAKLRKS